MLQLFGPAREPRPFIQSRNHPCRWFQAKRHDVLIKRLLNFRMHHPKKPLGLRKLGARELVDGRTCQAVKHFRTLLIDEEEFEELRAPQAE